MSEKGTLSHAIKNTLQLLDAKRMTDWAEMYYVHRTVLTNKLMRI